MYFFDLGDYYNGYSEENWYEDGVSNLILGCAGSPIPYDWEDYFSVIRSTRNAFLKSVSTWFIGAAQTGFTENIDIGCSPSYLDLWVDFIEKKVEYEKNLLELNKTIFLYTFNYDYSPVKQSTFPTYEEYYEFAYVNYDQSTGTSVNTVLEVINPLDPSVPKSAITVNYDFGTTFENSDLENRVTNYDTAMKEMMCSLKNMWSVIDGDTFDELWVDENGNFVPNSGTTYCLI